MLGLSQAEQRDPDSGLFVEMIGTARLVDEQTFDFRVALRRRQRTQVDLFELQWPAVVDNGKRLAINRPNGCPQVFTPLNNDVEGLFQHLGVQLAPEPRSLCLVINRLSGNYLFP